MSQRLKAVYRQGAFVPEEPCQLPEGAEVELIVEGPTRFPPEVTDPQERLRILKSLVEDMMRNPIPADAPHFTREMLHERR